jgi:CheY-like chemotaxis protein
MGLQKLRASQTAPSVPPRLEGLRVLVVDDNATNRLILTRILTHWRMEPFAADGGASAILALEAATLAGSRYPLVLLDAQMPEMDGFTLAERIRQASYGAGVTVLMLSSSGLRGDGERCRQVGIAAYLTKPFKQSELLDAILTALGTLPQSEPDPKLITRHSLRESGNSLRILVAEDNAVNQMLALRLLEKRGHKVRVAANGKLALEYLDQDLYDLVLMDVQMPEMGGFEATAAIREKEKLTGAHIPIVAMTANAMKGDEEECIASGMDAYVSKPLNVASLFETIQRLCPGKVGAGIESEEVEATPLN